MHQPSYAGIGSRHTPAAILQTLTEVARQLACRGYTLRSGAAEGADMAFEIGAHLGDSMHETYLPWPGYNDHNSLLHTPSAQAAAIARTLNPVLLELNPSALKRHARNVHEVLGAGLDAPVDCVICWTRDGKPSGSTATVLRLAQINRIPVFNLGDPILASASAEQIVACLTAAAERSSAKPERAAGLRNEQEAASA